MNTYNECGPWTAGIILAGMIGFESRDILDRAILRYFKKNENSEYSCLDGYCLYY